MSRPAIVVLLLVFCAGCGPTTLIRDSWRDPALNPAGLKFKKVLMIGIMKDETSRRAAEDRLVQLIQRGAVQAIPSYSILTDAELKDAEQARAKIAEQGFDGAIVMRLARTEQQVTWSHGIAGDPYAHFWGYYRWGWGMAFDPGYLVTEASVHVETMVYSVSDDKLVWASLSESFYPTDTVSLVTDVARAVHKKLKDQGLVD